MGIILGKFRKKKSTYEVLDKLDTDIKSIEEYRFNTEQEHKKVGRFIVSFIALYVVAAIWLFVYNFPKTFKQRLQYAAPIVAIPFGILIIKRQLSWWYNYKINRNRSKLIQLRQEKRELLNKVMDTETYNVAREILDKFAPDQLQKTNRLTAASSTPMKQSLATPTRTLALTPGDGLRQRNLQLTQTPAPTPLSGGQLVNWKSSTINGQRSAAAATSAIALTSSSSSSSLPLPRKILPRDRGVMERMVEYIVGDGPSNRFALICCQCNSHNGMALKEEFEYIAFRCCYCYYMNPARKQRPVAPKLDFDVSRTYKGSAIDSGASSDSEKNSASDGSESDADIVSPLDGGAVNGLADGENSSTPSSPAVRSDDAKSTSEESVNDDGDRNNPFLSED